jgi:hypothetical protein
MRNSRNCATRIRHCIDDGGASLFVLLLKDLYHRCQSLAVSSTVQGKHRVRETVLWFETHSLRQLHRREYSLSRCDASKIATLCGAFAPNLCTSASITTAFCALCWSFFSRPVDYGIWYGFSKRLELRAFLTACEPHISKFYLAGESDWKPNRSLTCRALSEIEVRIRVCPCVSSQPFPHHLKSRDDLLE